MKKYIKATSTSGLIGIWWIKDDTVIADYKRVYIIPKQRLPKEQI